MTYLTEQPLAPADLLASFTETVPAAGAVVSFAGHVRPEAGGAPVTELYLQAHPVLTDLGIDTAGHTAAERWPLEGWMIRHRIGAMGPGDAIVFVATASVHRRAAFKAADYLMDYLKTEAVFWKKEKTETGAYWIEPREDDYADAARWAKKESV